MATKNNTNKTKNFFVFLVLFSFFSGISPLKAQKALSPRNANYDIDVKLNHETRMLEGSLLLHWQNLSPDTIKDIFFHTYLNAFKNTKSTFMAESGGQLRGDYMQKDSEENPWGWIDIESMNDADGNTLQWKYTQPDDENVDDQTVVTADLKKIILPYETTNFRIKFKAKLPKVFARTGFTDEFYLVGQWFPKVGVYEPEGMRGRKKSGWNCHQFHAHSEFYADFGVYNVNITVPDEFIVGASGMLIEKSPATEGFTTYTYKAEDVVDFAWTASPLYKVGKGKWKNTEITILLQPEHFDQLERHHKAIIAALDYFEQHMATYPYPSITIVDPPTDAKGAGGMEYPMFITAGTNAYLPEGIRMAEMVTVHEFGHQYFMGILATNEFEEAWMDEGINSFYETQAMDWAYGEQTGIIDLMGVTIPDVMFSRMGYSSSNTFRILIPTQRSWDYKTGGYSASSYSKPATMLNTLLRYVGQETMDEIFKTYYQRWKFKHPGTQDFVDVANEVIAKKEKCIFGKKLNSFFDQFLYNGKTCDYKLRTISNKKMYSESGIFDSGAKKELKKGEKQNDIYKSSITLDRLGDAIIPVEVKVTFEDGTSEMFWWDGKDAAKEFKFEKRQRIISAELDPNRRNLMDTNLNNNSMTTKKDNATKWKLTTKFLFWIQNIFQFLAGLI